jgi:hypothetical protein
MPRVARHLVLVRLIVLNDNVSEKVDRCGSEQKGADRKKNTGFESTFTTQV